MDKTIAFLELKYGHVYGGSQWQKVVNDASVLVYKPETNRIRIYTKTFRSNLDIVLSHGIADEYGITSGRKFEVLDMANGRIKPYDEEFQLSEDERNHLRINFTKLKGQLKQFILGIMKYHRLDSLITYGGSRDISLLEHSGIRFNRGPRIEDTQRLLQKYTKHLFSLNMISKIVNFEYAGGWMTSNNCEYRIADRTQPQMRDNTATYDVCRAFLAHMEFTNYQQDMIIKAALQMQKVQSILKEKEDAKAAEEPTEPEIPVVEEEATVEETDVTIEETDTPDTTEE